MANYAFRWWKPRCFFRSQKSPLTHPLTLPLTAADVLLTTPLTLPLTFPRQDSLQAIYYILGL